MKSRGGVSCRLTGRGIKRSCRGIISQLFMWTTGNFTSKLGCIIKILSQNTRMSQNYFKKIERKFSLCYFQIKAMEHWIHVLTTPVDHALWWNFLSPHPTINTQGMLWVLYVIPSFVWLAVGLWLPSIFLGLYNYSDDH